MRFKTIFFILGLLTALPLAGCNAVVDRSLGPECGWEGSCCWADGTCHEGYVCNEDTKLCEVDPNAPEDQSTAETDASIP